MKHFKIFLVSLVFSLSLSSYSQVQAQDSLNDFTLVNKTGYVISHVYVSPTKADDWGEDVMGENVIGIDEEVMIKFPPKAHKGLWDLQVVYEEDDSSAEWVGYDLTTINKIIIRYDKKRDVTTAEVE
jgi:hypothetical protein